MKKLFIIWIIILAFTILQISLYAQIRHTKQSEQSTKPTHEERVEVVEETENEIAEKVSQVGQTTQTSLASWYGRSVCGERIYGETCKTANGEIFDEEAHTMACSYDFALGDRVELCYLSKCIVARCTDRGNFERLGRTFDLSRGLFSEFDDLDLGVIEVEYKTIKRGE